MILIALSSCKQTENFITYYNAFYNMERITKECEMEFDYQTEKRRNEPRIFIPRNDLFIGTDHQNGTPPFLRGFIITQQQRQPVIAKIDSILIKGSKILAIHPTSDYIEGSLFLMAKAFFFKNEWLPSQIKCSELIDKYPDGEFSPDAHLLYSINLLIQRKFYAGEIMLSRTVDIAWQLQRYDILSEAFRLQAELAIYQDDLTKALRPYKQAILQSDESRLKARWQIELAALLYRQGYFDRAAKEFAHTRKFNQDYQADFESYLYQGASLAYIGEYEIASDIFEDLDNDGKYEEWKAHVFAQRLNMYRLQLKDTNFTDNADITEDFILEQEQIADSIHVNHPSIISYYYLRGTDSYFGNDYEKARKYFARSRVVNSPVQKSADRMYNLLNIWSSRNSYATKFMKAVEEGQIIPDSVARKASSYLYELARVHERLDNSDSVKIYYRLAAENSVPTDSISSKYYYNYARVIRDEDPFKSDSLMEIVILNHPKTPFAQEAMDKLGYTDNFVIDTVNDLMNSGNELMKYGDYEFAMKQFKRVFNEFPDDQASPKALYSVGWIYEIHLVELDTALYYYKMLIDRYPDSDYAEEVRLSVDFKLALDSGEEIPDSLKKKIFVPSQGNIEKMEKPTVDPRVNPDFQPAEQIDPKELMKNPGKFLDKQKNLLQNPKEMLNNQFSLPKNAKDFIKLPDKIEGLKRVDDTTSVEENPQSDGEND